MGAYDSGGRRSFAPTVLMDPRERLRRSKKPNRMFETALGAAQSMGLVGRRPVFDSTPLYDAAATMDTVTLRRSAVRGLLKVVDGAVAEQLRALLASGDDHANSANPQIDWDDADARDALVDSRVKDAWAGLALVDGRTLSAPVAEAAQLLATVAG